MTEEQKIGMLRTQIDEGPCWWTPESHVITRLDEGVADPCELLCLPGANDEHLLFADDPTGGYGETKWNVLVKDIKERGVVHAILIFKEMDGRVNIHEGNHRLRAAVAAHLTSIPVEVRYFGNSQRSGLVLNPGKRG